MVSYQEALRSVLDCKIQSLTQLQGKLSEFYRELETLNRMKKDTELKLRGMERPGRRRKGEVDQWLKDVEQIEKRRQDIANRINEILTYESTDEVIEEVIEDVENHQSAGPSDDGGNISGGGAMAGVKKTIIGIGGIGETIINVTDSPTTYHIKTVQIVHNYDPTQGNGANGEEKV